MRTTFRYDRIGKGYSQTRCEDPVIRDRIHQALGNAQSVVNVGAGTGSYEPTDRQVLPIEPSDVMVAQRPRLLAPAICAVAGQLPLQNASVDAAMTVLSLHHWDDVERGVRELRRVAKGRVVLLTYDGEVSSRMWLMADYLPEVAALDRHIFPAPEQLAEWLGGDTSIEILPIHRDCKDWMLGTFWAHPERVLDSEARAATSGFARMDQQIVDRVVRDVSRDLESGAWDQRYGELRKLQEFDAGLRLVVAN